MAHMKGLRLLLILFMLVGPSFCTIQLRPQNIGDVLKVDTRDYSQYRGSCLRRLRQGLDGNDQTGLDSPAIYDPNAAFGQSRGNALNNIWYQMYTMVTQTRAAMQDEIFSTNIEVMKLIYSFWGLKPAPPGNAFPAGTKNRLPGFCGTSFGQKFDLIRTRLWQYQKKMEEPATDERSKAKLFCDGAYFTLQNANNFVVDARGIRIKKPDGNSYYTLGEWEALHGRNADDRWWFYYKMGIGERGDERAYMTVPKSVYPERAHEVAPWPTDPRTKQPNPCLQSGESAIAATVLHQNTRDLTPAQMGGMGAWAQADHIILCPSSFLGNLDEQDQSLNQQQAEGTHLDLMSIVALTLVHEFGHYCFPDNSIDYPPCFPFKDKRGTVSPRFPYYKSGWDCEKQSWGVFGAAQAMTLARYEIACDDNGQPTTDIAEMVSWRAPEVYAWFMRAMLLTIKTRQDWSTGAARAFGSPAGGVTAIIPEGAGALQPRTAAAAMAVPSGSLQGPEIAVQGEGEATDLEGITELLRNDTLSSIDGTEVS